MGRRWNGKHWHLTDDTLRRLYVSHRVQATKHNVLSQLFISRNASFKGDVLAEQLLPFDVSNIEIHGRVQGDVAFRCVQNGEHHFLLLPYAHRYALWRRFLEQWDRQIPAYSVHTVQRYGWDALLYPNRVINVSRCNSDDLLFVHFLWWLSTTSFLITILIRTFVRPRHKRLFEQSSPGFRVSQSLFDFLEERILAILTDSILKIDFRSFEWVQIRELALLRGHPGTWIGGIGCRVLT